MKKPWLRLLFCLLVGLSGHPATAEEGLRFGVSPQFERRQLLAIWLPILNELEQRTGRHFQLVTPPDIPTFEKQYNAGAFDLAYVNPYLIVANPQKYQPLIRDAAPLKGIVVVAKDSPIQSLADLAGKEIAFPAPNALAASLLIRAELSETHHLNFTPRYVNSHTATYLNVAQGLTAAGGGVQKTFNEQKEATQALLRIIYTTPAVPSLPVAAHPRVPTALQEKVRAAFLALADTPNGKALLGEIPMTRPIATSAKDYEVLRELHLEKYFVPGQ